MLNRLPLAILVFRDQQVMFAYRALTDLLGYENVESLRGAGIASIFPGDEGAGAGPVNRIVRRDGTQLPVTARLQSGDMAGTGRADAVGEHGRAGARGTRRRSAPSPRSLPRRARTGLSWPTGPD